MLPLLYPGEDVPRQIIEDFERAPIPELHKHVFRWTKRFVAQSWQLAGRDVQSLREAGLSDSDIVSWAQIACLQTWWVMSADGGGIPLEGDAVVGPVVGGRRENYEAVPEGRTAAILGQSAAPRPRPSSGLCWADVDESGEAYREAAAWARERYGFVPNLLRAVSLRPEIYPRHVLALELLERPQSASLSPRQHAMVRALVSALNRCEYSRETTRALLDRVADAAFYARVAGDYTRYSWEPSDRAILDFATKMARNHYKVTEKDAISLREAGLDDEAYVDVLNTVAIQTSLDRLANSLGVVPDSEPIVRPPSAD